MEPIPDFSNRRSFPGSINNDFDVILRRADAVDKIPAPFFAGLLFLLALPATWGRWPWTAGLWLFFLADWLLLYLLKRTGRSFGPPKAQALTLAIPRTILALLPLPLALALQAAGTLLVLYGYWYEPHHIRVTRQSLKSPKLAADHPLRVLHLSDLHVERISPRERQLNRLIAELKPDLIIFSGDIINLTYVEDPQAWQSAREVMRAWDAPGGVYVVSGSPAVDLAHVFPGLVDLPNLTWLNNRCAPVTIKGQTIDIIGVTCTHKPFVDGPMLAALLNDRGPDTANRFTLLLYHTPDLAPNAANTGKVDLQVSGHTHGGQVRFPALGALYAGSLYGKRFQAGRYQVGPLTLYVSRGIGLEGKAAPRVRFLCAPEVILWELDGDGERNQNAQSA